MHERIYSGRHKVGDLEVCINSRFLECSEQLQDHEQTQSKQDIYTGGDDGPHRLNIYHGTKTATT